METTSTTRPLKDPKDTERIGLLNPSFKYVSSANTDIRKTFERIRQARQAKLTPDASRVV